MILDAGGCAGNICGFDEPRWFDSRSAIFSAGLRDMDAILGRDDRLVEKTVAAARKIDGSHVAIIGTPVPAVIATDYRAVGRMIKKETGLPVITLETNGTRLYDWGASLAWKELFETFVDKNCQPGSTGRIGLLGASPLEFGGDSPDSRAIKAAMVPILSELGLAGGDGTAPEAEAGPGQKPATVVDRLVLYGMGDGLDQIREAGGNSLNIVLAPAGLAAARYLEKNFGTPWFMACPPDLLAEWTQWAGREEAFASLKGKKILIVHQQALANRARQEILGILGRQVASVTVASWFMMDQKETADGDLSFKEEGAWMDQIRKGGYDVIFADPLFKRAVPDFGGQWIDLPHFAVSGKARPDRS